MTTFNKNSSLIQNQLPAFIRDEPNYEKFVLFLKAYYQWLELAQASNSAIKIATSSNEGVLYGSKNLQKFYDVDSTLDDFIQYYIKEFMPLFPKGALADKRKLLKNVKQLYKSKGTPASYQFLFRSLYDTEAEIENTRELVLRPSDGKWVQTKYLNVSSTDPRWATIYGKSGSYKLFGKTSKGSAIVESVEIGGTQTKIILSVVERSFVSGETIVVVNDINQEVLIDGTTLTGTIIGQISGALPDPANRGLNYNVGDPVVFYGGLNPAVQNPQGASGYISEVTAAQILSVDVTYGGHGYRPGAYSNLQLMSVGGSGASVQASSFDTANNYTVYLVPQDTIDLKANTQLGNSTSTISYNFANLASANFNTPLYDALYSPSFVTYPIAGVSVVSPGANYDTSTMIVATATYLNDSVNYSSYSNLVNLGILSPIDIISSGLGYANTDTITFVGGRGYGAFANVVVDNSGRIVEVNYVKDPNNVREDLPLGGMGYIGGELPTIEIGTLTGVGAQLSVPSILGQDAMFNIKTSDVGQVKTITVTNVGQDYISSPKISLRVEDLLLTNISLSSFPKTGNFLYQGSLTNQTYISYIDSINVYQANTNQLDIVYEVRTYEYNGYLDPNQPIKLGNEGIDLGQSITLSQQTVSGYTLGQKPYGNGSAKATVKFFNGVVFGSGFYINKDGQPSGYSVLQNLEHNDFTYRLSVEAELSKYKDAALTLLHPSGTNYVAVNMVRDGTNFNFSSLSEELKKYPLSYLLGGVSNYVSLTDGVNSNTLTFDATLSGANIAEVVFANSIIHITPTYGSLDFVSEVVSTTANTITMKNKWINSYSNVVYGQANSGSNIINIDNSSITKVWKQATGVTVSQFSDFIHINDFVSFDGTTYNQVIHVDQPGEGSTITINGNYGTSQNGYISLISNTLSSNIYISTLNVSSSNVITDIIQMLTESGANLTTEDLRLLLVG